MAGKFAGGLRHRREDILRAERHLDLELLRTIWSRSQLVSRVRARPVLMSPNSGAASVALKCAVTLGKHFFQPGLGKTAGVRRRADKP